MLELHGNILRARCTSCGLKLEWGGKPERLPPTCPECGGLLRPDVVWFSEPLDKGVLEEAFRLARQCDVMIVIGTSGAVDPAGLIPLVAKDSGAVLVNVNPEPNRYTGMADVELRMKAVQFAERVSAALGINV